jgi:C-terminal processing protease CtpA/Prc
VISERGTDGAGGTLRQAKMPGQIVFTYTGGQMFFKGTHEVNLEAKGVTPDFKVPINEENERRKLAGEDVVLDAAIKYLDSVVKPTPNYRKQPLHGPAD